MVALMVAFVVVGLTDVVGAGTVQFITLQPAVWFSALPLTHFRGGSEHFIHWQ